MKKKIRVLVPTLILETLEKDFKFWRISKEKLCNEILFKFSLRFRSNYQNELFYEDKEYLQFTLSKENQAFYRNVVNKQELSESEILREIFIAYAVLCPSLRELNLFREKIVFINNAIKEYRCVRIDVEHNVIEGRIIKLFRCKEAGYLKICINEQEYYLGDFRILA